MHDGDGGALIAPRRGVPRVPSPRTESPVPRKEDDGLDAVLGAARRAQPALCAWPQERVDRLVGALADVFVEHSRELAGATVAETGLGNVPDKTAKNEFAARAVAASLRGQPAHGVLKVDEARGTVDIARPVGVVLGLMPVTNPVATLVFTALIALKARNALVLRPHRQAAGVSARTAELLRATIAEAGAPPDLLHVVRPVDRAQTQRLFRDPRIDVVLATGGTSLVRAAQASGKPTLGAGAGNAPAWIAPDADVEEAAGTVVGSKAFDHGIICGSEQHLLVDRTVRARALEALIEAGARLLTPAETERLTRGLFLDGAVRPDLLGRSPQEVAAAVGITAGDPCSTARSRRCVRAT